MTAPEFLASLPADPARALAQIDGALAYGDLTPEYRQALVTKRAELMRGRK